MLDFCSTLKPFKSYQYLISRYSNTAKSFIKLFNKFSLSVLKEKYREQYGEY